MLTVYGIKSCETCRNARKFLNEKNIEHTFHDLRQDGLSIQMLERWITRIGWERLLNKKSLTWRKIPEVDRNELTRDKALAVMIESPTLIKRP
jgi:arsenate reductase